LEHPQPFWFYVPVLLALFFPWTPLFLLLGRGKLYDDVRARFLAAWVLYGLVFFSVSVNKLPGYLLPLMPAIAVLLAVALDRVGRASTRDDDIPGRNQAWWLAACALMLVVIPTVAQGLPQALLSGLRTVEPRIGLAFPFLIAAGGIFALAWTGRSSAAVLTAVLAAILGAGYLKMRAFPALDAQVSARVFAEANAGELQHACIGTTRRMWVYGLNYYLGRPLPQCDDASDQIVEGQARLELHRKR
jgi:4-amino-4-deoxy-L-arabinose transferase-like glycosyltransferase